MTEPGLPAGQHSVRQHNLRLVLSALATASGSKAELAQRTGLTKATVASLVDVLIERQVLLEAEPERSGPGRPARSLSFHPGGPVALGVELNVDYTAVRITDLNGMVLVQQRQEIDNRAATADEAFRAAAQLCRDALGADAGRVLGVALALPAVVGLDGRVLRAPNLPLLNAEDAGSHLGRLLALGPGVPIMVENEANLAALARLRQSPGEGNDFVYVSAEIGIGAGIVVGGSVFRGVHGFAGELGHVVVDAQGPACGCGGRGCVEQYAGMDVLLRRAGQPDLEALMVSLSARDEAALSAVAAAGRALGVGLASLLNVFDLPVVVLGGVYAALFDALAGHIRAELTSRVLGVRAGGGELHRSSLGADAAVRGATNLVIDLALRDPALITERAG